MSDFVWEDDDGGFEYWYEEKSVDPGPSLLIGTIIFCVLSLAILPFLMSLRNRWTRRRSSRESSSTEESENSPNAENRRKGDKCPGTLDRERLGAQDNASVVSSRSNTSSVARSVLNAILDGNPRSGPNVSRARAQISKRQQQLEDDEPSVGPRAHIQHVEAMHKGDADAMSFSAPPLSATGGDDCCNQSQVSALSRLDQDEVSIRDAVDADSVVAMQLAPDGSGRAAGADDDVPFWRPLYWARAFDSLLQIAEADVEMKRIVGLAAPFVMQALAEGVMEAVNVALIGKFIGTSEVAAYVTTDMLIGVSGGIFSGFHESLTSLCSQAIGVGNKKLAGNYLQIAVILYLILFTPMILFWMFYMDDVLRWFKFDEETVRVGAEFTRILLFVEVVESVSEAVHALLDTIDKETYSSVVTIAEEVAATIGVGIIALGDNPSLEKIGLVYLFVSATGMFFNVLVIMWKGWFDPFLGGIIGSFGLTNARAMKTMLKTSISLSLGYVLSYSEWEFLALTAKKLGPAEVTAWGILGTLWDVVELVTEAVADAAEVRVAMLLGCGQPQRAQLSASKSIYLGTIFSMMISAAVFIVGDDLPTWMTKDATLQRMLAELIPLFGLGNIALTVGTLSWTAVGAQGRYRLSTAVGLAGSWFITMPLAAVSTIVFNLDLQGQTAAVVVGYMVSGTINSYLLFTSDWEKLSREVIAANADIDSESSSSGSSSSALPESIIGRLQMGRTSSVSGLGPALSEVESKKADEQEASVSGQDVR